MNCRAIQMRSADFQSAVSQIFNLQPAAISKAVENFCQLQNGILRYSRLGICATSSERASFWNLKFGASLELGAWSLEFSFS
jgi:hypothetical protein